MRYPNFYKSVCHEYPIHDGIVDLRPLSYESAAGANHYEHIHKEQQGPEENRNQGAVFFSSKLGLDEHMINDKVVLVAGLGLGDELSAIHLFKPKCVVALDYSNHIRSFAKASCNRMESTIFVQADIMNLPFKTESFDLVINAGVMHHVRSPELGFRNLYRVVRTGGMISIGSIYPPHEENLAITRARIKYKFHEMSAQEATDKLSSLLRQRLMFERFGIGFIHSWLCGNLPLGNPEFNFNLRLGNILDHYFPEYRHVLHPAEIREWFRDVGIEPTINSLGDLGF